MITSSGDESFRARRSLLFAILVCLAAFLAASLLGYASAQQEEEEEAQSSTTHQPNIVFILTDDLDFASAQKMPEIRSLLVEEGTSFDEAFVSHPVCCPSRATILTGLYDHNHNVLSNNFPSGGFEKFVAEGHETNSIAVHLPKKPGIKPPSSASTSTSTQPTIQLTSLQAGTSGTASSTSRSSTTTGSTRTARSSPTGA